jgi:RNA polymerase primary sigma factor
MLPPTLGREEEIRITKQIEEGQTRMERAVFSCATAYRGLCSLGNRLEKGKIEIEDVIMVGLGPREPACCGRLGTRQVLKRVKRILSLHRDIERVKGQGDRHYRTRIEDRWARLLMEVANLKLHHQQIENLAKRPKDVAARLLTCDGEIQAVEKEAGRPVAEVLALARLARRGGAGSSQTLKAAGVKRKECLSFEKRIHDARRKARRVEALARMPSHQLRHVVGEIVEGESMVNDGKKKMMEVSRGIVSAVATRHLYSGIALDDLIREGNIGLTRAVERFDYREGRKFSTYAIFWIRQAIVYAISDRYSETRKPDEARMIKAINNVLRAARSLARKHGREPSPEEIAKALNMPLAKVKRVLKAAQEPIALDRPESEGKGSGAGRLESVLAASPLLAASFTMFQEAMSKVLSKLTRFEEKVIRLRFGIGDGYPRTLDELSSIFDIDRDRVQQIELKALRKLDRNFRAGGATNAANRQRSRR